jgi:UDP-N-acetylmuramyl pentapeptide phosphotransferase/UDP-N-acetylglucosamine-1-phosphate transferase
MNSKKGAGIGLIITTVISLYGYSMCSNKQNVIMILLPALVSVVALSDDDIFKKINSETESFFSKRKLLLFLMIAITVSIPVIIGTLPIESEIFSRSTFIIFREE